MDWKNFLNENRLRKSCADPNRKQMSGNLDARNPFESDFGRVVFSAASRRLHDKTQVFPLTSDDNIHSRLTHSMEVMNIGLSFSIYLAENEEFRKSTGLSEVDVLRKIKPILQTSCLVHDIGNPPFGHFGEQVYQDYFSQLFEELKIALNKEIEAPCLARDILKDLTDGQKKDLQEFLADDNWAADYVYFDGNAEGLRVLTRLQYIGDLYGLNLTFGSLGATLKYPNPALPNRYVLSLHKHGVFHTEISDITRIADGCDMINADGSFRRHPLSFLMEAADSICYLVMDVEDAGSKGWLKPTDVISKINEGGEIPQDIKDKILKNSSINQGHQGSNMKNWVALRTTLLSHLMEVATKNFVTHLSDIEGGTYNKELIEDGDFVYKKLKRITNELVFPNRDVVSLEITGRAVITGLFNAYLSMLFHSNKKVRKRAKDLMSKSIFKAILHEHLKEDNPEITADKVTEEYNTFDVRDFSVEERFRLVRDYVACMTDKFALSQFQRISGQKI